MLHKLYAVRLSTTHGLGVFAVRNIAEGEVIWRESPWDARYPKSEISTWTAEQQAFFRRYCYQVDDEWFAGPRNEDETWDSDHMNHSCDPNTWWSDDQTMTARRTIDAGEELTFDYATSDSRDDYAFDCHCGTSLCRGTVRGSDFLRLVELQQRYGTHVQSFLLRRLADRGQGSLSAGRE
jgi:SET domain-containing protein